MNEHIRLGDVFALVGGGTPSTSKKEYWGNGVPWFSSADIGIDGKISCRRAVTPLGIQNSTTNIVPAQTVVVVTRVGLGKVAKLPCNMCFSQDIQALQPVTQTPPYNELFLMHQLSHIMSHVKFQGRGTTISGITKKQLNDVILFLPPLVEQIRIVARIEELFSQLDASVNELIISKERLKVYQQAILKETFDAENADNLVELSEIVKDIRIGPFGTMLHREDYVANGIPVINPKHIKRNRIIPNPNISITKSKASELAAYSLFENDIIMGRRGEMGRCAAVTAKEAGWICGTGSILIRLKSDFDALLYSKILSSPKTVQYLEEHAIGTTMKNLNESIIKRIPVPRITRDQQQSITANLDAKLSVCIDIGKTVDTALQQSESLRQSILKKAFVGGL